MDYVNLAIRRLMNDLEEFSIQCEMLHNKFNTNINSTDKKETKESNNPKNELPKLIGIKNVN